MKALFVKDSSLILQLIAFTVLSVVLMVADHKYRHLDALRYSLTSMLAPIYWAADLPPRIFNWGDDTLVSRKHLKDENESLKARLLIMEYQAQRMASLTAENVRLRELLNSSEVVNESVRVAEIMGVDPDPYSHQVVINKGSADGVFVGQPVLDANGLMGQVTVVAKNTSRVLLIIDASHAIPVQVNRNGVRAIATGIGQTAALTLQHVPDTADIKEGDLLVSSGLGERFPAGYPVAVVTTVVHDPGRAFAIVTAKPSALLDRGRHVLLVFTDGKNNELDRGGL